MNNFDHAPGLEAMGILVGPIGHVDPAERILSVGRVALEVPPAIDLAPFRTGLTVTVTYERHHQVLRAVAIRLGTG